MKAEEILVLLANRHSDDVFVAECKDGPTGGHAQIDGWAMKKSWAHPAVTGYEIKVSRQDFLRDDKWPSYLPMCNSLYFVCPSGLIQVEEMPGDVGLMWVAKTGSRLYTKKKAAWRDVQIPESVFRYILMSRAVITREYAMNTRAQRIARWEIWLQERKTAKSLGWQVAGAIRKHVEGVEKENGRLKQQNEALTMIKERLAELGYPTDHPVSTWGLGQRLEKLLSLIPAGFEGRLKSVSKDTGALLKALEEMRETLP